MFRVYAIVVHQKSSYLVLASWSQWTSKLTHYLRQSMSVL